MRLFSIYQRPAASVREARGYSDNWSRVPGCPLYHSYAACEATVWTWAVSDGYHPGRCELCVRELPWRDREALMFHEDVYRDPPWTGERFWPCRGPADHYAHVSTDDPSMIAFTASPEHGEADRQTRMRPGKYLRKFFGDILTDKQITFYAEWFAKGERPAVDMVEVRFATTPDEIVAVYAMEGPSSCMVGMDCVRVYGAGDLAIAYVVDPCDEEILLARGLCWPEKKVLGRVYGEGEDAGEHLTRTLRGQGYLTHREGGTFDGARLLKEEVCAGYVMPYLDSSYGVTDAGDHWVMSRDPERWCQGTEGYLILRYCECCNEPMGDDYSLVATWYGRYGAGDHESWCQHCTDDGSFYCEATCETYADSIGSVEVDGETWCRPYAEADAVFCEDTNEWTVADYVTLADGTIWSTSGFAENGVEIDGEFFAKADLTAEQMATLEAA